MEIRNSPEGMEQLALFPEASICSSEGPRVKVSASRESGKASTEQADWQNRLLNFLEQCVPAGSSGKTYRGACPRSISEQGSMTSTFFSQRLQNAGIVAGGEYLTLNMCEWTATLAPFLKEDGVCSLSDILLPTGVIPHRYFLSRTACLGILRRAESRGKALPWMFGIALRRQAGILPLEEMTDDAITEFARQMTTEKEKRRCPGNVQAVIDRLTDTREKARDSVIHNSESLSAIPLREP